MIPGWGNRMQSETTGMARTGSGLIVPKALADSPAATPPGKRAAIARDMDGRRRVVFSNAERKAIDKAIQILKAQGIGFIPGCIGQLKGGYHPDGSKVCEQHMASVDAGTPDAGFRCNCTRVHFGRF